MIYRIIYHPHRKLNAKEKKNINTNFNHPQSVKRELPNMIQNISSALSKNKTMSNNYKVSYEKALKKNSSILDPLLETLKQDTTKICIAAEIKI